MTGQEIHRFLPPTFFDSYLHQTLCGFKGPTSQPPPPLTHRSLASHTLGRPAERSQSERETGEETH